MHHLIRHRPSPALVVSFIAVVLALGSVAWATIPGPGGVIKGCYANSDGLLGGLLGIPHSKGDVRIVGSGESCRSYETTLTWNQQGQPGTNGTNGATKVVERQGPGGIEAGPGATSTDTASCNTGEIATGGGSGMTTAGAPAATLLESVALPTANPSEWIVVYRNDGGPGTTLRAQASVLCASP